MVSLTKVETLKLTLLDKKLPLSLRFRALFTLKSINNAESIKAIEATFDINSSALLNHELAYVLGQMHNPLAIPALVTILESNHHSMTRHEAAEAIGAIGLLDSLQILEKYANISFEADQVVRETCELAIAKIRFDQNNESKPVWSGPYTSIDPAPPASEKLSTKELGIELMNIESSLFQRYRAMFALRNKGDVESVLELAKGFKDSSALFRHEIAYVFGQMQHPASIESLSDRLADEHESPMVRHECAEALGSIATEDCLPALNEFVKDQEAVVKDSCIIGLDMWEQERSGQFECVLDQS